MNKFVVFTVLTGNYEAVQQPALTDSRFDYVLFTNDVQSSAGVWSVRPIPEVITGDNKRLSRYPKTHPETLLADYKASLYLDANIQIRDQWVYDRVVELYEKGVEFAERTQAQSPIVDKWNDYMQDVLDLEMDPVTGAQPKLRLMFRME